MKIIPILFFLFINSFIFAQNNNRKNEVSYFELSKDTLFIQRDTCWFNDSLKQTRVVIDKWDSKVVEAKLDEIQQLIKEKYKDW